MADMTFKTNLLPKVATGETQSTYSLGSSTQRWKIYGSMPNTMRYATCSTAADTAAKEATIADGGPSFELVTGSVVFVKFTNSNNVANPTLNIGSTGAKSIICYGTTAPTTGVDTSWYAGAIITCIYDGTNWCLADFSSRGSDASNFMVKGTDYVTAGQKSGTTLGTGATAEGTGTTASAQRAHAEGWNTTASAIAAHAEGQATHATGQYSHAEGRMTSADEAGAHAEGMLSSATGQYSHAEGQISSASGQASHAEGAASAGGDYAHAEGNSHADGQYSHADGCGTSAQRKSQHTFGEYNVADTTGADGTEHGEYIEIVGNGTADDARSNARTLDWNGNETLAGKLTIGVAPTASMDVATKQYVDTAVANGSVQEVEYVTYNSSTSAEIEAAYSHGKTVFVVVDDDQSATTQIYPLTERSSATSHTFIGYDPIVRAPVEISCYNDTWSIFILPALPLPINDNAGQVLQCTGSSWISASIPQTWYGTSSTASGTAAKVVTCADYKLVKGSIIGVLFTAENTAATPTLNVNTTGAKSIYIGNTAPNALTNVLKWSANTMLYFMYDGTYYRYITSVAAAGVAQPRGANTWYGTSSTAAATAAKASTIANYVLTKGSVVTIAFSTANTTNVPTLNINSTGAKNIWYNNKVTSATNPLYWAANDVLTFIYDGSHYVCVNNPRQDNGIIRSTEDPTNASSYPVGTIWIKYGADPMATMGDYITDTGTSGIWTYRKWNSGIAECWGLAEISGLSWVDYTTGGTPTCFNSPAAQVPMPASLFTSITSINANTVSAGSNVGWVANTTFLNNNVQLIFVRNGTAGVVRAYIDIKGRWKA